MTTHFFLVALAMVPRGSVVMKRNTFRIMKRKISISMKITTFRIRNRKTSRVTPLLAMVP